MNMSTNMRTASIATMNTMSMTTSIIMTIIMTMNTTTSITTTRRKRARAD